MEKKIKKLESFLWIVFWILSNFWHSTSHNQLGDNIWKWRNGWTSIRTQHMVCLLWWIHTSKYLLILHKVSSPKCRGRCQCKGSPRCNQWTLWCKGNFRDKCNHHTLLKCLLSQILFKCPPNQILLKLIKKNKSKERCIIFTGLILTERNSKFWTKMIKIIFLES